MVPRPARASEANPAYPELPATSQAPDPNLAATSQARIHPKATPACPDSAATSQACDPPFAPRRQLSYGPFEPPRDQVRREGINPFTSQTKTYLVRDLAVGKGPKMSVGCPLASIWEAFPEAAMTSGLLLIDSSSECA